ncbi:ribosomal protein L12E/L44/L45/RPP1/RPP2 [Rhodoligotrophos appendicifer]|uniref:hypothetical protein n=1 Tax=Rhodoligotrophos appendicifer TaxID=987056 RepID=UPI00195FD9F3|nr:hypothetical protein [Rhodoligotrophos appendicifer]
MDTAAFEQGLRSANTSLGKLGAAMKVGAAAIAAGMVTALGSLSVAMKGSIDEMDEMSKTSQKMGVPVEQLGKLKYAADLSGVSMEGLTTAFTKLSKNMADVASGGGKQAAAAFDALDISVKNSDGSLRATNDVMQDVAAKFAGMDDGATKTSLAMQIFGKSGADLIPLLNSGASGLKEMGDEAAKLGLVFSTETAKAAEGFNDNLTRLGKVQTGLTTQFTAAMLPSLKSMTDSLVLVANKTDLASNAGIAVGGVLKVVATGALVVATAMGSAADYTSGFANAAYLLFSGEFKKAFDSWVGGFTSIGDRLKNTGEILKTIWSESTAVIADKIVTLPEKIVPPLEIVKGAVGGVNAEIQSTALSTQTLSVALTEAGVILEENMTPAEAYRAKMDELDQQFATFKISQENYSRASQKTAQQYAVTWNQAAGSIAGSLAQITGSFGKNNEAMAVAGKAFGIVQAIISTYTGMAKALELPFPANLAAAATVAAQGFAFVASIKSTAIPSFAHGGSFKVGGAGGIDNNRVMMDLTRGERVDITPAGQDRGGEGKEIVIQMAPQRRAYDHEEVIMMISGINDALSDGHVLKIRGA